MHMFFLPCQRDCEFIENIDVLNEPLVSHDIEWPCGGSLVPTWVSSKA